MKRQETSKLVSRKPSRPESHYSLFAIASDEGLLNPPYLNQTTISTFQQSLGLQLPIPFVLKLNRNSVYEV
jgi:hypothetical protein